MRRLSLAAAIWAALAVAPMAQEAPDGAIRGVIQNQIDAFLKDDFATAFTFASPTIKRIFGDPETFGRMVRTGYPMVWRPEAVQFGGIREEAGQTFQRVIVRDASGRVFVFDYEMIETAEGWQINGVFPVAPGAAGA